jgi:hypothetical protein
MVLEGIDAHAYDVGNKMLIAKMWPVIGHLIGRLFFGIGSLIVGGWRFFHEKIVE